MLIDAHAHIVSSDLSTYPVAPLAGDLRAGSLDDPLTAERLIGELETSHVTRAVVIQRAHIYGYDNSYLVDSCEGNPDQLAAVCCLDAEAAGAGDALTDLVVNHGVVGVRLTVPVGSPAGGQPGTDWFAAESARAVWRAAAELDVPLCLHLFRWNRDESLPVLAELMRQFPDVNVVLDHVANAEIEVGLSSFPGQAELLQLVEIPRLYVKVAGLNFARLVGSPVSPSALMVYLVRHFGASRVLWGSDVTQTPGNYADLVAGARASVADLSADDADWVLGRTAAGLYPGIVAAEIASR
jgi:L-fuconolactonase